MYFRDLCRKNCCNGQFIGVVCFIVLAYVGVVWLYLLMDNPPCDTDLHQYCRPSAFIPLLIIFHIFFLLMLWSFIRVIISDPGRVPIYWGFFLDERESKRKRYCLLCHSFKPERCHHCSTCQRCVLNMDHHCPWIGNCVGYMNRKFFILFLFYIILTVTFALAICLWPLIQEIIIIAQDFKQYFSVFTVARLVLYIILAVFLVLICVFFRFHVELIFTNLTTIDNLERQRNPAAIKSNVYDMGGNYNFQQVFGKNVLLWPFPIFCESGKPNGDGVKWDRNTVEEE
jgi:hypothetical protein